MPSPHTLVTVLVDKIDFTDFKPTVSFLQKRVLEFALCPKKIVIIIDLFLLTKSFFCYVMSFFVLNIIEYNM